MSSDNFYQRWVAKLSSVGKVELHELSEFLSSNINTYPETGRADLIKFVLDQERDAIPDVNQWTGDLIGSLLGIKRPPSEFEIMMAVEKMLSAEFQTYFNKPKEAAVNSSDVYHAYCYSAKPSKLLEGPIKLNASEVLDFCNSRRSKKYHEIRIIDNKKPASVVAQMIKGKFVYPTHLIESDNNNREEN